MPSAFFFTELWSPLLQLHNSMPTVLQAHRRPIRCRHTDNDARCVTVFFWWPTLFLQDGRVERDDERLGQGAQRALERGHPVDSKGVRRRRRCCCLHACAVERCRSVGHQGGECAWLSSCLSMCRSTCLCVCLCIRPFLPFMDVRTDMYTNTSA